MEAEVSGLPEMLIGQLVADGSLRTVRNILARGRRDDSEEPRVSNAGAFLHGRQALLELPR